MADDTDKKYPNANPSSHRLRFDSRDQRPHVRRARHPVREQGAGAAVRQDAHRDARRGHRGRAEAAGRADDGRKKRGAPGRVVGRGQGGTHLTRLAGKEMGR